MQLFLAEQYMLLNKGAIQKVLRFPNYYVSELYQDNVLRVCIS